MTEYALVTLVTAGLLVILMQAIGSNLFSDYLDKFIDTVLIRPLGGLADLPSALMKISRY